MLGIFCSEERRKIELCVSELILNKTLKTPPVLYPSPSITSSLLSTFPAPLPVLFTHKLVHERRAAFALDVATPVELAVAALVLVGLELVVPSAAAHELAAVHAL